MGGSSGWLQAHGRLGRALQKQQSQVTSAQSMGIQSRWKRRFERMCLVTVILAPGASERGLGAVGQVALRTDLRDPRDWHDLR